MTEIETTTVPVSPGDRVRIRLREDDSEAWSQPMSVHTAEGCFDPHAPEDGSHVTTICPRCITSWSWDYHIECVN